MAGCDPNPGQGFEVEKGVCENTFEADTKEIVAQLEAADPICDDTFDTEDVAPFPADVGVLAPTNFIARWRAAVVALPPPTNFRATVG